jgi:hypothetical protein
VSPRPGRTAGRSGFALSGTRQHRVRAPSGIDDERLQAGGTAFALIAVALPGVIYRRLDAGADDRGSDDASTGLALLLHVQTALPRQDEATYGLSGHIDVAGLDGARDERVATIFGLIDEDVPAHAPTP